jgi:hypothetical protein
MLDAFGLDAHWWMESDFRPEEAPRGCVITTRPRSGGEGGSAFGLYLARTGFTTWKAVGLRGIAG